MGFIILSIGERNFILFIINFLLFFSIIGGSLFIWLIFPFFNLVMLRFFLKIFILLVCFLGIIFGIFIFNFLNFKFKYLKNNLIMKFRYFFSLIWFIPIIFCNFFNIYFLNFINKYKFYLDIGWIEYIGGGIFIKFFIFIKFLINFNIKMYYIFIIIFLFFILLF